MELQVMGKGSKKIEVSEQTFGRKFNQGLAHQAITAYLAAGRQGSKAQKTRSEVSGGGKKPWRQKGTGRARAGTIRSPLWRGGGVTFAAAPRDYTKKINKKMYKQAMASILSELVRQGRLKIIEKIDLSEPKTKNLVTELKKLDITKKALIVTHEENQNLELASRNLPDIEICYAKQINPVSLVSFEQILFTVDALKNVEERLS